MRMIIICRELAHRTQGGTGAGSPLGGSPLKVTREKMKNFILIQKQIRLWYFI